MRTQKHVSDKMKLALSDDSGEEESKYEFSQKHNRNDNDSMFQDIEIARLKKELEKANKVSQLIQNQKFLTFPYQI